MKIKKSEVFLSLWKILWKNYITDITNITLGVVLTTVTLVCWLAFKDTTPGGFHADPFVLASGIGISTIRNGQYIMNLTLNDWRSKGVFRKINQTPISNRITFFVIWSFNFSITLIINIGLLGIGMIFADQRAIIGNVNWLMVITGIIFTWLLSSLIAILTSFIWNNYELILVFSLVFYFGAMYLLGLGIPWNNVISNRVWNIVLYIFPHRYTLNILQAGWTNDTQMKFLVVDKNGQLQQPISTGFGYGDNPWIPYVVSISMIVILLVLIITLYRRRYRFNARSYKSFNGYQLYISNLNKIKKANSIEELNNLATAIQNIHHSILNNYNKRLEQKTKAKRRKNERHK